jgi:hypothetical protein
MRVADAARRPRTRELRRWVPPRRICDRVIERRLGVEQQRGNLHVVGRRFGVEQRCFERGLRVEQQRLGIGRRVGVEQRRLGVRVEQWRGVERGRHRLWRRYV